MQNFVNFDNFALNSSAVREALGVELGVVVAEVHLEAEDLVELPLDAEWLASPQSRPGLHQYWNGTNGSLIAQYNLEDW